LSSSAVPLSRICCEDWLSLLCVAPKDSIGAWMLLPSGTVRLAKTWVVNRPVIASRWREAALL